MADQIALRLPKSRWKEGSGFTATANFRDRATSAASVPASARYRVDCLTTGRTLLDWTSISPASTLSIEIAADYNRIQNTCNAYEIRQLAVEGDTAEADQIRETITWRVENVRGIV